ncbi:MAG: beta-ketoacyl-[acyl-carrier-protein] synthase family protein [Deltaproteobacteria bacterium]|nr:beta-ketoacyl-[acyl-carrier-protein] synthase family protein [Deltaproteobacteria bacterium]
MTRRVVVTGLGIITSHGVDRFENLKALNEGRDSISAITLFDATSCRGSTGGEARDFSFDIHLKRLKASRLDRASKLLLTAFEEAKEAASFSTEDMECPVLLGTTLGGMISGMKYHRAGLANGFEHVNPAPLADYRAHTHARNLMKEYGLSGEALTFSDACTSGANAIGRAFRMVRSGGADIAVAGGYDTMCEFTFAGFNSLQAVTVSKCRPFDRDRDGLALGEGTAVLILEEMEYAKRREAAPIVEIIGYASTSDAYHITRPSPDGDGARRAMEGALDDAGIDASKVDYINAHGTGTVYNDLMEARAINAIFKKGTPVSSTKAMVGHLLGGAGAVEAVFTIMAIKEGFLPPNINLRDIDPEIDLFIPTEPDCRAVVGTALSNSFGFGGANASLIFQALSEGSA